MEELPRDVIAARLALAEALDELLQAGEHRLVMQAVERVRGDLRVVANCARRMAADNGDPFEPRPKRPNPEKELRLQEAMAQITAIFQSQEEKRSHPEIEGVAYMADHLDRRKLTLTPGRLDWLRGR
jgi:hypothetical protein